MRKGLVFVGLSLTLHVAGLASLVLPGLLPRASHGRQTLSGETFELPAPETAEADLAAATPTPVQPASEPEGEGLEPTPPPRPAPRPAHRDHRPSGGRVSGTPDGTAGGTNVRALYGAVGDRSATDLANAFTRGFPQASSADPIWQSAPLGAAGEATLSITLTEDGRIESSNVSGNPSPPFASAIRKTLALIQGRSFVARAKTTKLVLTLSVANDTVHDGFHGDVFAIGGSFTGSEGSAFFALAIGRRIDLRVRAR